MKLMLLCLLAVLTGCGVPAKPAVVYVCPPHASYTKTDEANMKAALVEANKPILDRTFQDYFALRAALDQCAPDPSMWDRI